VTLRIEERHPEEDTQVMGDIKESHLFSHSLRSEEFVFDL
jgi:hypothetical protein